MISTENTNQQKHSLVEILNLYWSDYYRGNGRRLYLRDKHFKAVNQMVACRSSRLGIRKFVCEECQSAHYVYRSCKHRFCNRCGVVETYRWADQTLSHLLEMKHHHVVMTLPSSLRGLSKSNGDLLHDLLFRLSGEVLKKWFRSVHGFDCGIVSVLHTAGSDLKYHPHVHMIVSGGGMDGDELVELKGDYLCSQRSLANGLRRLYVKALLACYDKGELEVYGKDRVSFLKWLGSLNHQQWICSIQPPLRDVSQIVGYVGRYTKRSCLSEYKLESIDEDQIRFRFNDYKNTPRGEKAVEGIREMESSAFLDALLQHVPEKGYRMVRYYGLYSSRKYSEVPSEYKSKPKEEAEWPESEEEEDWGEFGAYRQRQLSLSGEDPLYCAQCDRVYREAGIIFYQPSKQGVYEDSS